MLAKNTLHTLFQLPGPKGLPILGNLLQLDLNKLHLILEKWADLYGEIYKFKIANKTVVAISNSDLMQNILRDRPESFRRISTIESAARELGAHGVFTAEGERWRRERYVTMQAFKTDNLRRFFPVMVKITERLHRRWSSVADEGLFIEARDDWMRFTIDITTNFAFGYDINLLENESVNFQGHLERLLAGLNRRTSAPFPYWHYIKLPSDYALEKSLAIVKGTIGEFMEQTRQRMENEPKLAEKPTNFLEALLLTRDEEDKSLSYEEIHGNVLTMLLAGEDMTANTFSWVFYFMTEYPEVQHKMQQEVDADLDKPSILSDINSVEKLAYIEAVILETLRLKSAAPLMFLETNIEIELKGVTIPKETPIMLLTRYGALQEDNFTDALHFKPERWLEFKSTRCTHNRNASLPFGAGSRACPGRNLAMLEIKMAMAMVCKNFSVSRVDAGQPVQEVFSFTMMPDNLKVKFEKR
jgi:cytochrome P450